MTPGTAVYVSGSCEFEGIVKGATDTTLIIDRGLGQSVTLRRDPASATPMQWRCQGLPVEVRESQKVKKPKAAQSDSRARLEAWWSARA